MAESEKITIGILPDLPTSGLASMKGLAASRREHYTRLYAVADSWVDSVTQKKSTLQLLLHGMNGSGKSSMACYILAKVGRGLRITMTELMKSYFKEWDVPDSVTGNYLVIIDEIGK